MTIIEMKNGIVFKYIKIQNLKIYEESIIEVDGIPWHDEDELSSSVYSWDTLMRKDVKRIVWEDDELDNKST